jgi:hypothetical protein
MTCPRIVKRKVRSIVAAFETGCVIIDRGTGFTAYCRDPLDTAYLGAPPANPVDSESRFWSNAAV